MMESGLLKEVRDLYDEGIKPDAIGYKEFFPYFEGLITEEEAIAEIKKNSRHYAKRQITWFKRNDDIEIVEILKRYFKKEAKMRKEAKWV